MIFDCFCATTVLYVGRECQTFRLTVGDRIETFLSKKPLQEIDASQQERGGSRGNDSRTYTNGKEKVTQHAKPCGECKLH
jgi:hypothetical protein